MTRTFNNCSKARKPNLVEIQVVGEPKKMNKNPKTKLLESNSISYLRQYSRKQLPRIERIKQHTYSDINKHKTNNNLFVKDQDFNNEIKIMKFEIRGIVL